MIDFSTTQRRELKLFNVLHSLNIVINYCKYYSCDNIIYLKYFKYMHFRIYNNLHHIKYRILLIVYSKVF